MEAAAAAGAGNATGMGAVVATGCRWATAGAASAAAFNLWIVCDSAAEGAATATAV